MSLSRQSHIPGARRLFVSVSSDPQRAAKASGGVIGLGAVVVDEDGVVAAVAEESAAECSDGGGCFNPA